MGKRAGSIPGGAIWVLPHPESRFLYSKQASPAGRIKGVRTSLGFSVLGLLGLGL